MNIEITTTTKKLTKSLLRQMPLLSYLLFNKATPLGYIRNLNKFCNLYILCEVGILNIDYFLLNALWERRGTYGGYNISGHRGEFQMKFQNESNISIDQWFEEYDELVGRGKLMQQIYY